MGAVKPFDCRFDLVFSIGGNCSCAMYLNETGLRMQSSPFDWIAIAPFAQRIETLCCRFGDFLRRENLSWVSPGIGDAANDIYEDKVTGYRFVHDFPRSQPFEESYPAVRAKYDRRISRLLAQLDAGISACLVWWSDVLHPTDAECMAGIERVRRTYPLSDCRLLVFENNRSAGAGRCELRRLSANCVKVVGDIAPDGSGLMGDKRLCTPVFRSLRKGPILATRYRKQILQRMLVRLLTFWHVDHEARKRARAVWKARLGGGGQGKKVRW